MPGVVAGKALSVVFPTSWQDEIIRLGFLATNSVLTALTAVLLYFLCRRLGAGKSGATWVAFAFGLGTSAWANSATCPYGSPRHSRRECSGSS